MTPEEKARLNIDHLLELAGWRVQDIKDYDPTRSLGVAVREFPLSSGEADYVLFVDRIAVGVIEAKPERDKVNLDISWLRDESLEDSDNLPDPDVIAQEIAGNLEDALEQFSGIVSSLK